MAIYSGQQAKEMANRLRNLGTIQANGQYLNPSGGGYMTPEQYKSAVNNMTQQLTGPYQLPPKASLGVQPSTLQNASPGLIGNGSNIIPDQYGNAPGTNYNENGIPKPAPYNSKPIKPMGRPAQSAFGQQNPTVFNPNFAQSPYGQSQSGGGMQMGQNPYKPPKTQFQPPPGAQWGY